MANPIMPAGFSDESSFIEEEAKKQDEERSRREASDHFEKTGEQLPDYKPVDPLVPINGYTPPDVATDGDSYDESGTRRLRSGKRDGSTMSKEDALATIFNNNSETNSYVDNEINAALRRDAVLSRQNVSSANQRMAAMREIEAKEEADREQG